MVEWLDRGDGVKLAYELRAGHGPTLVFLPGYRSDLQGSKAVALDGWCQKSGRAMLRLDYSGHGASEGAFEQGSIGRWVADAAFLIDATAAGDVVLVGSSMGGWIALLLALRLGARVKGLVLIAPAPDFSEELMWPALRDDQRRQVIEQGQVMVGSDYGDPYPITRAFIEDGRKHLLLGGPIAIDAPVRLLHGQADAAVPWQTSLRIAEKLTGADVRITLVKDGDHRLSRPQDVALLLGFFGEDGV